MTEGWNERVRPIVAVSTLVGAALVSALALGTLVPNASAEEEPGQPKPRAVSDAHPDEHTPQPSADEWRVATPVDLTRTGPRYDGCQTYRVREWLRISCPERVTASIAMLGGEAADVSYWIDPPDPKQEDKRLPRGGEIQFPLRRGDRYAFQMLTFGPGYEGPFTQLLDLVVQAYWLENEASPVVTAM